MVDLSDDDGPFGAEAVLDRLRQTKTVLAGEVPAAADDPTLRCVKTLLVANKIDLPGAIERLEIVRELFGTRFPIHVLSAEHSTGLEELRTALYQFLNVIRVYTKQPGKPPDLTSPFTLPIGGTVTELAEQVHREVAEALKSARIWGTGVFDGQTVKRDHVLHDKDIVELHA